MSNTLMSVWATKRELITRHVLFEKGYGSYVKQLKTLIDNINRVLADGTDLATVNMHELAFGQINGSWWKHDFPAFAITPNEVPIGLLGKTAEFVTNPIFVEKFVGKQSWMTSQQRLLFKTCIGNYFNGYESLYPVSVNMEYSYWAHKKTWSLPESVRDFVSQISKVLASPMQRMLAGAGPFLVKVMQQIGNNIKTGVTATLTQAVFDDILPLTEGEFTLLRDSVIVDDKYKNIDPKPLGSASIGQTHKCVDDAGNGVAVIKFIKPVNLWLFFCEVDFLLSTVWGELSQAAIFDPSKLFDSVKCKQMLLFLIREFSREFDVASEERGTLKGTKHYNRRKEGLKTPTLFEVTKAPVPALVMEFIAGQSLESFLAGLHKQPAELQGPMMVHVQKRLTRLTQLWLEELFWGSGWFDADPHKGNIMVPTFEVLSDPKAPKWIALLDFGSYGRLTPGEQCRVLETMLAASKMTQYYTMIPQPDGKPAASKDTTALHLAAFPFMKHFRKFNRMSAGDQVKLISTVKEFNKKHPKAHLANIETIHKVVSNIWGICGVQGGKTELMIDECLNYSVDINFGHIFLTVAEKADTIGTCTSSSVLMYGRGSAYLFNLWGDMNDLCLSMSKNCDMRYAVSDLISWWWFLTHPGGSYNLMFGCPR